MNIRTAALSVAALTAVAAPALAQADLGPAREPAEDENKLAAGTVVVGVLGSAAVVAGTAVALDGGDEENSVSA